MSSIRRTATAEFNIDREKAVRIGTKLSVDFYQQKGYFAGYVMPEYATPTNVTKGSREHALYLTYVISVDYMTNASVLWSHSRAAYRRYPRRFEPSRILQLAPTTLIGFTRALGARYPKSAAQTWRQISKVLLAKYESDPRLLTPEPLTIAQVKARLNDFPYLRGYKLSNFFLRVMGETGLLRISNFNQLNIPVDVQVARFTVYTGVVRLVGNEFVGCVHRPPLRVVIEDAWRSAAGELGLAPWKLDPPIWTIGSQLCSKRKCSPCPVKNECSQVKHVTFRQAVIDWLPQAP